VKKSTLIVLSIVALALAGCKDKPATEAPQQPAAAPAGQMPPGHPSVSPGGPGAPGANNPHASMKAQEIPAGVGKKAKVTQTIDSTTNPPYTYIEVSDEKGQKLWLALPQVKVKVGDTIEYPDTPPMSNFTSKTLNRTFEKLAMVPGIRILK
jgi:hypothetical protein